MFRRTMSRTGLASSIGTPFRLGNGFSWIEIIVPANKSARGPGNGVSPRGSYHHRTGPARSKAVFHPGDLFHSVVIVWGSQTTYYSRYMCLMGCLAFMLSQIWRGILTSRTVVHRREVPDLIRDLCKGEVLEGCRLAGSIWLGEVLECILRVIHFMLE
jgi:hypothetical protein